MCFKGTRALFKYTVSYTSDICARSEQCGEFVFYIGIKLFLIAPLLGCYWFSFMQLTPCQFIDFSSSKALLRLFDWKLILVNKIPYKTKEDPNVHLKICAFILIFLILYRDFSVCLRALKCHKIASFCCGGNWLLHAKMFNTGISNFVPEIRPNIFYSHTLFLNPQILRIYLNL